MCRQPRSRGAEKRDERAPLHSITSSARASSGRRHVEAERLGGLEVDHRFVLGRRLHRQIGRLLALEDAVDVAGGTPVLIVEIRPVGCVCDIRDIAIAEWSAQMIRY